MSEHAIRVSLYALLLRCNALTLYLLVFVLAGLVRSEQPATKPIYVPATLWSGVLVLQSGLDDRNHELPKVDLKLLVDAVAKDSATCLWATAADPSQPFAIGKSPTEVISVEKIIPITPQQFCDAFGERDAKSTEWAHCKAIWLDTDAATSQAISQLDDQTHRRLIECLQMVLLNGGFVRVSGDLSWLGEGLADKRSSLLLGCTIDDASDPAAAQQAAENTHNNPPIRIEFSAAARLALSNRQAICTGDGRTITLRLPPTQHYPQELRQTIRGGDTVDWVQWQRTLIERQQPAFPGSKRSDHQLVGGALVIGGGGGMPSEVWGRFVELAGGANARIVILPTAVEEPTGEPSFELRLLKQAGAEHVVTLPQTKFDEIADPAFLAELDKATGVWFGGGRQWRFVDAYWGTPAWEKLQNVCERGGVIGGSSAGATIQGDLLVRGAPAGNHIMIADGYRHGLGLLPGVAIDQHFSQRNRFRELETCLAAYPAICGIGIDEQTALVVTATNQCDVIGNGSVWHYPSYDVSDSMRPEVSTRSNTRKEFKSGITFSLSPK